jgi:hypothetical protein
MHKNDSQKNQYWPQVVLREKVLAFAAVWLKTVMPSPLAKLMLQKKRGSQHYERNPALAVGV